MYQFAGVIKNGLEPENGVNMIVKGIENDRIILAPSGPFREFEKKQDGNTLTLTIAPSSGSTEGRAVMVEITNGAENTFTNPDHWEVQLTSSSDSEPTNLNLVIGYSK